MLSHYYSTFFNLLLVTFVHSSASVKSCPTAVKFKSTNSRMLEYDQEIFSNHEVKKNNLDHVLTKSINKIIQNEGYIAYSISVKNISTKGGNYLSTLKEVDIKGKTDSNNKETNLFIKLSLSDSGKNPVSLQQLFANEVFTYKEIAQLFNELQNEFNVPDKEQFQFVKYYDVGNNSLLIFDNMIRQGFKICNRFDVPPVKTFQLSIKELAKFHGFSMVLKQYRPEFYKNNIQTLKHTFKFDENGEIFIQSLCNVTSSYLENDRKIKIEKFLPEVFDKFNRYVNKNESKVKCLCHGDYRMNNILVKETNGEATTVIPIDYQGIYYGSPVLDLMYSIFLTTDQQFRKDHMENLKNIYFHSLAKYLRYFNIDVESVYPRKEFEIDFYNHLDFGLLAALIILPVILVLEDDVPEFNSEIKSMKLHDSFQSRIQGIVDDFIEWGFL